MGIKDSLHLSKDALLGMPIITIIGRYEVHIENFKAIIEYSDTFIKLKAKKGNVEVNGKNLIITYYNEEEIHIKGLIENVTV